ncbi:MAG: Lrp/AsnC family transcriptional regulator [Candidatus Bathyarchaeia archaeon]
MPRKRAVEQKVLDLTMNSGDEGILQSELWRLIKADSREGSRTILRLERKGLIKRKKELHNGRWTYRVFSKRRYSKIDSLTGCPCVFCESEDKCGELGIVFPGKCIKLTRWIVSLTKK